MIELSYRHHRFPPVVIQHAVWLYLEWVVVVERKQDIYVDKVRGGVERGEVRSNVVAPVVAIDHELDRATKRADLVIE